jgi:hypothetical protein
MKSTASIFLFVLFTQICVLGQFESGITTPDTSSPTVQDSVWGAAMTITAAELKSHLYTLASDEFGGRELGSEGNLMAADYIADEFSKMGLSKPHSDSTYFQDVAFTWLSWQKISIEVNGEKYKQLWDFIAFQDKNKGVSVNTDKIVFVGFGIDDDNYSDYSKANVKGKVVMVYDKEPVDQNGNYLVSGTTEASQWSTNVNLKVEAAAKHGATHVLIIADNLKKLQEDNRNALLGQTVVLGRKERFSSAAAEHFYISSTMAKDILGDNVEKVIDARNCIKTKGKSKPVSVATNLKITQKHKKRFVDGLNVVGVIEGSDLKDEYILITAHYDHIGKKGKDINNGADDNASGTSTVLEIAEAFETAAKNGNGPRRTVVCMLVTGEEKGLLGSRYYVNNPTFPLEQSVVNINIDMVGRLHKDYINNPNYIYVIGSDRLSSELHTINEAANQRYSQLTLDYKYNSAKDPNRFYYRSDHYNFAQKGIPAIFFFNGTHEDYHRPSDTAEKINYEKMAKVGRHIFTLAWDLANRDNPIVVDGK